jgi:hypothetical protein
MKIDFTKNDKVVCVDATPIPHYNGTICDYLFPGGFIEEQAVYCVCDIVEPAPGRIGLVLQGVPCIRSGIENGWSAARFRQIESAHQSERVYEFAEPSDTRTELLRREGA